MITAQLVSEGQVVEEAKIAGDVCTVERFAPGLAFIEGMLYELRRKGETLEQAAPRLAAVAMSYATVRLNPRPIDIEGHGFDPDQPRDDSGRWTDGVAGGSDPKGKLAANIDAIETDDGEGSIEDVEKVIGQDGVAIAADLAAYMSEATGEKCTVYLEPNAKVAILRVESDKILIDREIKLGKFGRLEVSHTAFEIDDSLQGQGIASKLLGDSFQSYVQGAVAKVTVLANEDVGGYAWASAGFMARSEGKFRSAVTERPAWKALSASRQDELFEGMSRAGQKGPKWLADQPEGKSLLLGTSWGGIIDLLEDDGYEAAQQIITKGQAAKGRRR